MPEVVLNAMPLDAARFAPFGEVIEAEGQAWRWINEGTAQRFDDLARVDVMEAHGRPAISIFKANPRAVPFRVRSLERHPMSSQCFFPLDGRPYLVIVAEPGTQPIEERIRAFLSGGHQGVNYRRNTWHHSLIALNETSSFLVIDRGGLEDNCEEIRIDDAIVTVITPTIK